MSELPVVDHMLLATIAAAKQHRTRYTEVINVCQLALQELAKLRGVVLVAAIKSAEHNKK